MIVTLEFSFRPHCGKNFVNGFIYLRLSQIGFLLLTLIDYCVVCISDDILEGSWLCISRMLLMALVIMITASGE